jgi:hypothetical protein
MACLRSFFPYGRRSVLLRRSPKLPRSALSAAYSLRRAQSRAVARRAASTHRFDGHEDRCATAQPSASRASNWFRGSHTAAFIGLADSSDCSGRTCGGSWHHRTTRSAKRCLLSTLVWPVGFALLWRAFRPPQRRSVEALIVGLAVLSHFALDRVVHVPDLPVARHDHFI